MNIIFMNTILLEWYLLFLCLVAILILVILRKRMPVIILVTIAIVQHFLLHWNMVLTHWFNLFG